MKSECQDMTELLDFKRLNSFQTQRPVEFDEYDSQYFFLS